MILETKLDINVVKKYTLNACNVMFWLYSVVVCNGEPEVVMMLHLDRQLKPEAAS